MYYVVEKTPDTEWIEKKVQKELEQVAMEYVKKSFNFTGTLNLNSCTKQGTETESSGEMTEVAADSAATNSDKITTHEGIIAENLENKDTEENMRAEKTEETVESTETNSDKITTYNGTKAENTEHKVTREITTTEEAEKVTAESEATNSDNVTSGTRMIAENSENKVTEEIMTTGKAEEASESATTTDDKNVENGITSENFENDAEKERENEKGQESINGIAIAINNGMKVQEGKVEQEGEISHTNGQEVEATSENSERVVIANIVADKLREMMGEDFVIPDAGAEVQIDEEGRSNERNPNYEDAQSKHEGAKNSNGDPQAKPKKSVSDEVSDKPSPKKTSLADMYIWPDHGNVYLEESLEYVLENDEKLNGIETAILKEGEEKNLQSLKAALKTLKETPQPVEYISDIAKKTIDALFKYHVQEPQESSKPQEEKDFAEEETPEVEKIQPANLSPKSRRKFYEMERQKQEMERRKKDEIRERERQLEHINMLGFQFSLDKLIAEDHSICHWSVEELHQFCTEACEEASCDEFFYPGILSRLFKAYNPTPKAWAEFFLKFVQAWLNDDTKLEEEDYHSGQTMQVTTMVELLSQWLFREADVNDINQLHVGGMFAGLWYLDPEKWSLKHVAKLSEYYDGQQTGGTDISAFVAVGFAKCVSFDELCEYMNNFLISTAERTRSYGMDFDDEPCRCHGFECTCKPPSYWIDSGDARKILNPVCLHLKFTGEQRCKFLKRATTDVYRDADLKSIFKDYVVPDTKSDDTEKTKSNTENEKAESDSAPQMNEKQDNEQAQSSQSSILTNSDTEKKESPMEKRRKKKSVSFSEDSLSDFYDQYNDYTDEMSDEEKDRSGMKSSYRRKRKDSTKCQTSKSTDSVKPSTSKVDKAEAKKIKESPKEKSLPVQAKPKRTKKTDRTRKVSNHQENKENSAVRPKERPTPPKEQSVSPDKETRAVENGAQASVIEESKYDKMKRRAAETKKCQGQGWQGRPCTNSFKKDCVQVGLNDILFVSDRKQIFISRTLF